MANSLTPPLLEFRNVWMAPYVSDQLKGNAAPLQWGLNRDRHVMVQTEKPEVGYFLSPELTVFREIVGV